MFKPSAPKAAAGAGGAKGELGDAAMPLASGWLRTKGRDNSALVAAVAGNRLQQMKSWNLWWTVLSRGVAPAAPFLLRCYADQALTQLKARRAAFEALRVFARAPRHARRGAHAQHPRPARRMRSRWPSAWRSRCSTRKRLCSVQA